MPNRDDGDGVIVDRLVLLASTFHPKNGTLLIFLTAEHHERIARGIDPEPLDDNEILEAADWICDLDHDALHSLIPSLIEHHKDQVALEAETAAQARLN